MSITIENRTGQTAELTSLGFAGGERHIQLPANLPTPEDGLLIRAQIDNSDELVSLLLTVNALRHQFSSKLDIDLELPYLPYSRQDRVCASGQAFSLEVMAQLLGQMNLRNLTTWDCHSKVGLELTGANNISAAKIIEQSPELVAQLRAPESILISPDKGAASRCTQIQNQFDVVQMLVCDKKRDPASGNILGLTIPEQSIDGRTAIITDDICDGGFTFIRVAEQLRAKGAKTIILYVTHGLFSKGLSVFDGLIDRIYTSNSRTQTDPRVRVINYKSPFQPA